MTTLVIIIAMIIILLEALIFILSSRPITSQEEFEARRKIISYKINKIFEGK
jgi:hypothetical protein